MKAGLIGRFAGRWRRRLQLWPAGAPRRRATFVRDGLEAVIARAPRMHQSIKPIFDGEAEAKLIALACSEPPEGYARWTIRLLAEKVVELNIVDSVHFNTVGRTLKKTNLSLTAANTG